MGVFDFFGKDPKNKNQQKNATTRSSVRDAFSDEFAETKKGPFAVFKPQSFEEVAKIIDVIKFGRTAVVHLTELKVETAIRVLDMLSGAIYALGGGVYEVEKNIFMFSPDGVEMN